ncbi:hypothetical protein F5Y17DRAFT_418153 [Xylariaceae sp. FL0594]|nr:hypothetical protein F5Y17DRAFT_418153 [Xylariaceae sp. FL0594]
MAEETRRLRNEDNKDAHPSGQQQQQQHTNTNTNNNEDEESRLEWLKEAFYAQCESWAPWLEDMYLKYFTRDNKASYAARDQLNQTKVTNIEQVDKVQDGVNNFAADQLGRDGALKPVGDVISREGIERADTRRRGHEDEEKTNIAGETAKDIPVVGSVVGGLGL